MRFFFLAFLVLMALNVNAQWDRMNTNTNLKFTAIAFDNGPTGMIGYALAHDPGGAHPGQAYITFDNGINWSLHWTNDSSEYWDVTVSPGGWWWFIGDNGYYWCQNLSVTAVEGNVSPYTLYCGDAPTDSSFYGAGEHGMVYRTLDLGATWDTFTTGTNETINDIYFADAANGWIVANGGYLAVTADSGNTWTFVPQPQWGFTNFMSLAYQDTFGLNPYIVGEDGAGLFSINGGVDWFGFATNTTNDIHKIRFINTVGGLMCGDNGYISRTVEGGGWWFNDPSPVNVDLFDIAYAGDTTAFICGDSGVILRSRMDISSVEQPSSPSVAARAYPNPTNGPLFVEVMLSGESNVTVEFVDLLGQVIQTNYYEHVSSGVNRFECSTGNLVTGVYFMRVIANEQVVTMPVIRN